MIAPCTETPGAIYSLNDGGRFGHMLVALGGGLYFDTVAGDTLSIAADEAARAKTAQSRYPGRAVMDFVENLPDDVFEVVKNNAGEPTPFRILPGTSPLAALEAAAFARKNTIEGSRK